MSSSNNSDDVSTSHTVSNIPPPSDAEDTSSTSTSTSTPNMAGIGQWEEMHGNYILRPPSNININNMSSTTTTSTTTQPRALLHFLGGALVGAAPDLSYRYLLEKLASQNFLIVATPYRLSFDYIRTCDDIIGRFERVAPHLARSYGALPVVGVGHSCGALLQVLITSLFPDTPRAANALISYNNKNVKDAVPFFEEVVAPLFVGLAGDRNVTLHHESDYSSEGNSINSGINYDIPSSTVAMNYALKLGRQAAQGQLPPDDLLTEIAKFTAPKKGPLSTLVPDKIIVPPTLRTTIQQTLVDPIVQAQREVGILSLPMLDQTLDVMEQIPSLIDEVADGARDFNPPPSSVRAAARKAYRARRTLLIQYRDDGLDESELIESLLGEAKNVMRMKRPMVEFEIERTTLDGFHATPCLAPPLEVATQIENVLSGAGGRGGDDNENSGSGGDEEKKTTVRENLRYKGADETVEELVRWMDEGNL